MVSNGLYPWRPKCVTWAPGELHAVVFHGELCLSLRIAGGGLVEGVGRGVGQGAFFLWSKVVFVVVLSMNNRRHETKPI